MAIRLMEKDTRLPLFRRTTSFYAKREKLRGRVCRRQTLLVILVIALFLLSPAVHSRNKGTQNQHDAAEKPKIKLPDFQPKPLSLSELRLASSPVSSFSQEASRMHLLLPVGENAEVNLCRTLMTASVLGYPAPELLAYNETHPTDGQSDHEPLSKIKAIRRWLAKQPPANQNDLVTILDVYGNFAHHSTNMTQHAGSQGDAWLQLRVETLLARYHAVNNNANAWMHKRLGNALQVEGLKQTILFGSSKRCESDPHDLSCYAAPESNIPDNMYSTHTDKLSKDKSKAYITHRPRYLDTGFIMGPVSDVARLFQRAEEKVAAAKSPRIDERRVFQEIFGEQQYQREVMRRRDNSPQAIAAAEASSEKSYSIWPWSRPKLNILSPPFPHQPVQAKTGQPDEFGMGIDYWSDLSHSTADAPFDAQWIHHDHPLSFPRYQRDSFHCKPLKTRAIPFDIVNTTLPRAAVSDASEFSPLRGWDEIGLYTNVCLDTIPVVIQHRGTEAERNADWANVWMQPHGQSLMDQVIAGGSSSSRYMANSTPRKMGGGAYLNGIWKGWHSLCPANIEETLYMD